MYIFFFTTPDEIPSSKLLKATIVILDPKSCQKIYKNDEAFPNGFNSTIAVCAGDLKEGRDTCQVNIIEFSTPPFLSIYSLRLLSRFQGDSGGPLQIPLRNETCMYTQVAVTSTGSRNCGNKTPAVYTRIAPYIEWIQSVVWP